MPLPQNFTKQDVSNSIRDNQLDPINNSVERGHVFEFVKMGLLAGDVENPTFLVAHSNYRADPTVAKARAICQEFLDGDNGDLSLTIAGGQRISPEIQDAVRQIRTTVSNLGNNAAAPGNLFDPIINQVRTDISGNTWNIMTGTQNPPEIVPNNYLNTIMPGVNRLVQAGVNIGWIFNALP